MTNRESGRQKDGRRQEQAKPKPEQSEPGGLESNMKQRGRQEQKEYRKEYAPRVHEAPSKEDRGPREGTDQVPETRKVERKAEEAEKEARHKEQRDEQKQVQQKQKDKERREKKAANQI